MIPYRTLNCNGTLFSLEHPAVMGIVNVNSDSFFAGSRFTLERDVINRIEEMANAGVPIVDIGAMSSRPGSVVISPAEEWSRLSAILSSIRRHFPELIISIDTLHSQTARKSLDLGIDMINDISGGTYDPSILKVVGEYDVPFIIMHMKGNPENMQSNPRYDNVVAEVFDFFVAQITKAEEEGIVDLILDPGFGFGKNLTHNYQLLQNMHAFEILRFPILTGVSRKGMIQKILEVDTGNALNGTTAVHMLALMKGARILRAHDVAEAVECIKIWEKFNNPELDVSDLGPYIMG